MPEINSALAKRYVAQVEKENRWLPYLAKRLQTPISRPIAMVSHVITILAHGLLSRGLRGRPQASRP